MAIPNDLEWKFSPWSQACDMYRTQVDAMLKHAHRQMNTIADANVENEPILEETYDMLVETIIPDLIDLRSHLQILSEKYQSIIQKIRVEEIK